MADFYLRKEIEKIVVVTLREIFRQDGDFPYSDDDTLTAVMITPKYPRPTGDNKQPHIIVSDIGYSISQDGLFNNLLGDYRDPATQKVVGKKFAANLPVQVQLMCLSTAAGEAENLADKLFNFLNSHAKHLFTAQGIHVMGITAGQSDVRSPYPQFEFVSGVSFSGICNLTWVEKPLDETVLQKVKLGVQNY